MEIPWMTDPNEDSKGVSFGYHSACYLFFSYEAKVAHLKQDKNLLWQDKLSTKKLVRNTAFL